MSVTKVAAPAPPPITTATCFFIPVILLRSCAFIPALAAAALPAETLFILAAEENLLYICFAFSAIATAPVLPIFP